MWDSVRRGEENNIFPYQEQADVMFNSSLAYEISVLKPYIEPLLFSIGEHEPEYQEAKEAVKIFRLFFAMSDGVYTSQSDIKRICRRWLF